jgi:hypothetical protein
LTFLALKFNLIHPNQELHKKFNFIRRTRGDGNCFFRAFGFAYLESLIGDKAKIQALRLKVTQFAIDLTNLGYQAFTIDDFKDVVKKQNPFELVFINNPLSSWI